MQAQACTALRHDAVFCMLTISARTVLCDNVRAGNIFITDGAPAGMHNTDSGNINIGRSAW